MKALVTGASGFVGGAVARVLLARGYEVRCLLRTGSDRANIAGLPVEVAIGDLRDPAGLERALRSCDVLFHVGAMYRLWTPDPRVLYETNVQGTANILAAAGRCGIRKIVYTSSESTLHVPCGGVGDESRLAAPDSLPGHYKRSKRAAEQVALDMCHDGLPIVIVNPTTPVGPGDIKPTPTGRIIVDFLNRRMPGYVNTGLNLIDVADVAEGHVLALDKGRVGERYILGNENLRLQEILRRLARCSGLQAPRVRLPLWLVLGAAHVDERRARSRGTAPRIPLEGARAARKRRYFDCTKAIRDLGLPQSSVSAALDRAVRWFRQRGYVAHAERG